MQTRGIMIQTLCVPCACRCRYCLLDWDGKLPGAAFDRSRDYALRFYSWIKENRPALSFHFSFGFSMDHPALFDALDVLNGIGSVSGRFLQFDGFTFRSDEALRELLTGIRAHGAETLNFTFYGTEAYHDRFAARPGDYAFMLKTIRFAKATGLRVTAGVPLTTENAGQAASLLHALTDAGAEDIRFFVPHAEGRGKHLEPIRLTADVFEQLPREVKARLNRNVYKTEAAFCEPGAIKEETARMLLLSLTPETVEAWERTPFDETIRRLEELDETYYAAFPSQTELVRTFGDPRSDRFYTQRDLLAAYRNRFAAAHGLSIYDVTNERQSGSRRY